MPPELFGPFYGKINQRFRKYTKPVHGSISYSKAIALVTAPKSRSRRCHPPKAPTVPPAPTHGASAPGSAALAPAPPRASAGRALWPPAVPTPPYPRFYRDTPALRALSRPRRWCQVGLAASPTNSRGDEDGGVSPELRRGLMFRGVRSGLGPGGQNW